MMTLLGAVQGLSEFLPISSTGHIVLFSHFTHIPESLELTLILHLGSLLAVGYFFWGDIRALFAGFFRMVRERTMNPEAETALKLTVATIFTIPTALLSEKLFPLEEASIQEIALALALSGVLIILAEYLPKRARTFTWTLAIALGVVQGLGAIHAISRSGITIAFLVLAGIARTESARLSFLVSIPTIAGAIVFVLADYSGSLSAFFTLPIFMAFLASLVVSLFAITYMMKLIQGKWVWFAPYCLGLALLLLLL